MTGLNFAGGSEFVAVGLWTSPPDVLSIAGVTLLVNSRHLVMDAALAPWLRHLPRRRALAALFLLVDESWALALADAQARADAAPGSSMRYYLGVSSGLYVSWVSFTTLGALIGPVMGDIEHWGFDMACPAVFLVPIRGMWRGLGPAMPWLVSLVVAGGTCLAFPGAWYVPAGSASGIFAAWIGARS